MILKKIFPRILRYREKHPIAISQADLLLFPFLQNYQLEEIDHLCF